MILGSLALTVSLRVLLLGFASAAPTPGTNQSPEQAGFIADQASSSGAPGSTTYWLSNIKRQGAVAFGDSGYQIYRNVKDCGVKGDGVSDDTAALNDCIQKGNRCLKGCDSSTVTPALMYFPSGTYLVSKPIIQPYYTQFIGDALNPPVLKAAANFQGMAVIDSDPYDNFGNNWYTNQNNFFRQVRNFVIDLTAMPPTSGAGIHWQVAQATSLQNIRFEMVQGGAGNKQLGVFMDNGSGGFMSDLTFNGGDIGMFLGSQQFTNRNLTFNGQNTAIFMNWNWLWTFKSVSINNCKVGLDMANSPSNQTVGSVLLTDSKIMNTPVGVNSSFSMNSIPTGGGTLMIDNVDFTGTPVAVQGPSGAQVLAGGSTVQAWAQGRSYVGSTGTRTQGAITVPSKPASLAPNGVIFERSKPQYEQWPASAFVSVKSKGAKGDGVTDDTQAIQAAMNGIQDGQILYFDHGAYVITDTVKVPKNIKITGEIWPLIMASGSNFADASKPKPMWQVGQAGDTGGVEMSDLIFETKGPAPGAVLMEYNLNGQPGANGLWDVHFRVGGSAGTELQSDKCAKNPNATHAANPECEGVHTMFHATTTSSVLIENVWFWVSDHELDLTDHNQIDIYSGRGVLIESQGPMWLYGTASEHSVLYNYQLTNAKNIYMGAIQSETPYFQGNPAAPAPFGNSLTAIDPQTFTGDSNPDNRAWGLRVVNSSDVLVYGAGLYSFFDNYGQQCVPGENCQNKMVSIEGATSDLNLFGLSTKASVSMVSTSGGGFVASNGKAVTDVQVPDADNRSNFCATLAFWRPG